MKRYITSFMMLALLAVMIPFSATSAAAQTRRYYNSRTGTYSYVKRPNFYRRHRKAINIGAGTVAGMVVGGLIGGRRGAGIGALAGAGGGYLVTKKQRPKNYVRYYRNY